LTQIFLPTSWLLYRTMQKAEPVFAQSVQAQSLEAESQSFARTAK